MKKEYVKTGVNVFLTNEELHIIRRALNEAAAAHCKWAAMYEESTDETAKEWEEHHINEYELIHKIYNEL